MPLLIIAGFFVSGACLLLFLSGFHHGQRRNEIGMKEYHILLIMEFGVGCEWSFYGMDGGWRNYLLI